MHTGTRDKALSSHKHSISTEHKTRAHKMLLFLVKEDKKKLHLPVQGSDKEVWSLLRFFEAKKGGISPISNENGQTKFGVQICNICIARSPYTVSGAGSSVASSTMAAENMLTSQKYKTLKKLSI